jgi:7-keto-8-aminopelargonate synthetase-like enzyme
VVAAYIKALEIMERSPELLDKLHRNVNHFRTSMNELGFELLGSPEAAIVPGKII